MPCQRMKRSRRLLNSSFLEDKMPCLVTSLFSKRSRPNSGSTRSYCYFPLSLVMPHHLPSQWHICPVYRVRLTPW
ncbi:hypothetical protein PAXINDRAFT_130683, partial [Paxillus involutus ATCC 200175]